MIASLIILLFLAGVLTPETAMYSLYVGGTLLIIAELAVVSFGLIALNGLLALYAGYALQNGHDIIFGIQMDWNILFGIAFVEVFIIVVVIGIHLWLRNIRNTTGTEFMIGQKARIIEWNATSGSVRFEGEIWKAQSQSDLDLKEGDIVIIDSINKLDLIIKA